MDTLNECASLFPAPKTIRWQGPAMEIRNLCFPLEIIKKYDFLLDHFAVKSKNRGLEIVCQEKKTLAAEAYVIEAERNRVIVWSSSVRGQFYALSTLLQLLAFYQPNGMMPGFFIEDAPAIPFRGFQLDIADGAFPLLPELQRLLLKLALLRFNHFALRVGNPGLAGKTENGKGTLDEIGQLATLAGRMGVELYPVVAIKPFACTSGPAAECGDFNADLIKAFRSKRIHVEWHEKVESEAAAEWFERFLGMYRFFKAQGKTLMAPAENFLAVPEWIRKIPQDVCLLNLDAEIEHSDAFRKKAAPFKKHHIPQVLGTVTWSRARFIPAMRRSMANQAAAFAAVREDKLAGLVLNACAERGDGNFLEGVLLPLFFAGNLCWSGQSPRPDAFSQWALGRYEPDLFRVYTFLSQVDGPLQHTHRQYLFEDPLFANFSRQDNAKEIVARYRKTAVYLKKKKINGKEVADYLNFAQHLYEFIVDKIEFSGQFVTSLSAWTGDDTCRQLLEKLVPAGEKLKNLYINLWLGRCRPDGLARKIREFDLLQSRFRFLLQASAHPATRKKLLNEFENQSSIGE
ncbi:MAG TPA: glycoside hydrolase family 20 zincin-like fold domain-containing protein [Candidatus Binatia bacterium]|nr:glycoside hydrolase family 20 zincin-like fold domain-containing protein [Candidatus Binatia bacterium]